MIRRSFLAFLILLLASIASAADKIESPDKTLTAIIEPFLKINDKAAENTVRIVDADGDPLTEIDFRSRNRKVGLRGSIVDKIQWTSDSQFLVISTYTPVFVSTNPAGSGPVSYDILIYSRSDNSIYRISKILGRPVINSNFKIISPDTLIVFVRDDKTDVAQELSVNLLNVAKKKL